MAERKSWVSGETYIEIGVQTTADAFENQYTQHRVDKVGLHLDVIFADGLERLGEHVADLQIGEVERVVLDAANDMFHRLLEASLIDDQLRGAAALDHQFTGESAVEISNGCEQVQKVSPVGFRELRDKTRIQKDQLGLVALVLHLLQLFAPSLLISLLGQEILDDRLVGDDARLVLRTQTVVWIEAREDTRQDILQDRARGGPVEVDHDVARVQVGMREVVDQEHVLRQLSTYQESIQAELCDACIVVQTTELHKVLEGNSLDHLLHQNILGAEVQQRPRE